MEPRIQYAKTADGVSIAYWTLGEGEPLVVIPYNVFNYIEMEWRIPEVRSLYERLAGKRMLVRYDMRGTGLSQRDITDFSLERLTLDLEAVADRLGLDRFALFASYHMGPMALSYSTSHPGAVSRLILWCSWAMTSDYNRTPAVQSLGSLRDQDWETYTETIAQAYMGYSGGALGHRVAELWRESATQDQLRAFVREAGQWDVASLLPRVTSPTLVLHRRHFRLVPLEFARALASNIPNARLVLLEGESGIPFTGDTDAVASAIDEFLGEGDEAAASAETPPVGTVHTILFTDMVDSTALTQRLGDAKAQEVVRAHNTIVRDALKACGGSEIKHTGDGIMASFPLASGALECAVAIQRAVAAHVDEHPETPLGVHIGLNAGEPVAEGKDLFGTAVQLARRICDHAEAGQILAPIVVRELAAGKGFLFADIGESELRGFEDPVHLYEVRWREEA